MNVAELILQADSLMGQIVLIEAVLHMEYPSKQVYLTDSEDEISTSIKVDCTYDDMLGILGSTVPNVTMRLPAPFKNRIIISGTLAMVYTPLPTVLLKDIQSVKLNVPYRKETPIGEFDYYIYEAIYKEFDFKHKWRVFSTTQMFILHQNYNKDVVEVETPMPYQVLLNKKIKIRGLTTVPWIKTPEIVVPNNSNVHVRFNPEQFANIRNNYLEPRRGGNPPYPQVFEFTGILIDANESDILVSQDTMPFPRLNLVDIQAITVIDENMVYNKGE